MSTFSSTNGLEMVMRLLKCENRFPVYQLFCWSVPWCGQLCSQYLYEANSCYSTAGFCLSNIRSVSSAAVVTGTGSQSWKLLLALILLEYSRKILFTSDLGFKTYLFQDFFLPLFPFRDIFQTFKGENVENIK